MKTVRGHRLSDRMNEALRTLHEGGSVVTRYSYRAQDHRDYSIERMSFWDRKKTMRRYYFTDFKKSTIVALEKMGLIELPHPYRKIPGRGQSGRITDREPLTVEGHKVCRELFEIVYIEENVRACARIMYNKKTCPRCTFFRVCTGYVKEGI